jgi:hypothetical protein
LEKGDQPKMAVELRYHVIREGREVAVYTTKKQADEHDRMLDIAQRLADFLQAARPVNLDEQVLEELCVYLAKNRIRVIHLLKGGSAPTTENSTAEPATEQVLETPKRGRRGKSGQKSE